MGQQQLLLLVLGAVIVGLAIVIGINMFGQGEIHAQEDAIKNDLLTMASRVEEFWRKPATLGGGGKNIVNLTTFPQIGYNFNEDRTPLSDVTVYMNSNAQYTLTPGDNIQGQAVTWMDDLTDPLNPTRVYTVDPSATVFQVQFTESGDGLARHLNYTITP